MKENYHLSKSILVSNIKYMITSNIFDTLDLKKLKKLKGIYIMKNKLTKKSIQYFPQDINTIIFMENDPFTNENIMNIKAAQIVLFKNKKITKKPKNIETFITEKIAIKKNL
jgi:hypothetical protein